MELERIVTSSRCYKTFLDEIQISPKLREIE